MPLICQEIHLELHIPHQTTHTIPHNSWLMQEPPGLMTDWLVEIRWFVIKKSNISLYKRRSNSVLYIGSAGSLLEVVCHILWTGITFAFFHSSRKVPRGLYFAAFSNVLLEKFKPNLVLYYIILGKT